MPPTLRNLTLATLSLALCAAALTGCSGVATFTTADPLTSSLHGIQGTVHGGRQPIAGAHVYVLSANRGGPAGTNGQGTASHGDLGNVTTGSFPTAFDSNLNAYYVTTDANGNFNLTGEYTCSYGDQVYLYASGGNPGAGDNPYSTLMAVLGSCPGSGNEFASMYPFVNINEVTTVAAAYALAGYATNPVTISSNNNTLAATGIANAFATANNLADITGTVSGGPARSVTPFGNGTVPQAEINTLANAMAACINSAGNTIGTSPTFSSACSTLLSSAVTVSGGAATDTADAMINLAHNPSAGSAANIAAIAGLSPAIGAPYQPVLGSGSTTSPPNDFTIAIAYTGGGNHGGTAGLAVDASGNIWASDVFDNTISELSPIGVPLSSNGYTDNGGTEGPESLAFDTNGNLWVANNSSTSSSLSMFSSTGVPATGSPFTPMASGSTTSALSGPIAIAIDKFNHLYVASDTFSGVSTAGYLTVLDGNNSAACLANCASLNIPSPQGIAIDTASNAWIANQAADCLTEAVYVGGQTPNILQVADPCQSDFNGSEGIAVDHAGTKWVAESGSNQITSVTSATTPVITSFSGGGLNSPYGLAIDGAGSVWTTNINNATLSAFANNGTALSSSTGYQFAGTAASGSGPGLVAPTQLAIDGSGNVWVADFSSAYVTEFVGAAIPVVTPIVTGTVNNTLGTQP